MPSACVGLSSEGENIRSVATCDFESYVELLHLLSLTSILPKVQDWVPGADSVPQELLSCKICKKSLALVAQAYAPLAHRSPPLEERSLYLLGCPHAGCGMDSATWRALRMQSRGPLPSRHVATIHVSNSATDATPAFSEAADWAGHGVSAVLRDGDVLTGAGTFLSESAVTTTSRQQDDGTGALPAFTLPAAAWELQQGGGRRDSTFGEGSWGSSDEAFDLADLAQALEDASHVAASRSLPSGTQSERRPKWIQDSANQRYSTPGRGDLAVLPLFYIYAEKEPAGSRAVKGKGLLPPGVGTEAPEASGEAWEGEQYEYDQALSADRMFLKFRKRLERSPQQCLRYCFGGEPLWSKKPTAGQADNSTGGPIAPPCDLCGEPRVFEMQLMPPLLFFLQSATKDMPGVAQLGSSWEWLTVTIFTCRQSCWPSDPREGNSETPPPASESIVCEEIVFVEEDL